MLLFVKLAWTFVWLSLFPAVYGVPESWRYLVYFQEVKKAILEDIVKLGKESGLKSFEQVSFIRTKHIEKVFFYSSSHNHYGFVFLISDHIQSYTSSLTPLLKDMNE